MVAVVFKAGVAGIGRPPIAFRLNPVGQNVFPTLFLGPPRLNKLIALPCYLPWLGITAGMGLWPGSWPIHEWRGSGLALTNTSSRSRKTIIW